MPDQNTVGSVVATLLAAGQVALARWISHLHGSVTQLRERVARLEGRTDREDQSS